MSDFNPEAANQFIDEIWSDSIVPTLTEYIRIPNKSPAFDENWEANGHMEDAVRLLAGWAEKHAPSGMEMEIIRLPGRTPLIFAEIAGDTTKGDVLLYGHLDKQPEMTGWRDGYGPWTPVLNGNRLYGRGGADDGYSLFASLTSLLALQKQGVAIPRCVMIIEACEESGSYDLPHYIDHIAHRIGNPKLVVCLDSGCGNYEQLWCTTSLRGVVTATLRAETISEGVHSGDASGIVPDSFRVLRILLNRLEEAATGLVLPEGLSCQIPRDRIEQASTSSEVLGDMVKGQFPFHPGAQSVTGSNADLILNRTWRPQLTITGAEGLPAIENAGNVLRPESAIKLSLRLPPTVEASVACDILREVLLKDPPYGAKISLEHLEGATGWNAPPVADWLESSMNAASQEFFGKPAVFMGEGGTIPFMGMLGEKFPEAQFLITGVLGPGSNAHGPNEFLDIDCAKRITGCVASIISRM